MPCAETDVAVHEERVVIGWQSNQSHDSITVGIGERQPLIITKLEVEYSALKMTQN